MSDHAKIVGIIATCDDPSRLRVFMDNARRQGAEDIRPPSGGSSRSCQIKRQVRLSMISGGPSTHLNRSSLTRGKTTRLSRTRQKINRIGVMQKLIDFALSKKPTEGFNMLLERGMPELTGEAIVLRQAAHFDAAVVTAARSRLQDAGVDLPAQSR